MLEVDAFGLDRSDRRLLETVAMKFAGGPVGLSTLETHRGVEIALLAAATLFAVLPVFVLLPFLRKYLIKGLSLGALK